MNFNVKQKDQSKSFEEFLALISQLEAIEFLGLTKILCVPLQDEEGHDREFAELLDNVLNQFEKCGRPQRREILKALRQSTKGRKKHGTR